MEVVRDDFTFATSTNITERQNYGRAKDCQLPPYTLGAAMSINLRKTPFHIAESVPVFHAFIVHHFCTFKAFSDGHSYYNYISPILGLEGPNPARVWCFQT